MIGKVGKSVAFDKGVRGDSPVSDALAKNPVDHVSLGQESGHTSTLKKAAEILTSPLKSAVRLEQFALGFVGNLRRRAQEITTSPERVESQLKATGMHQEYIPPQNHSNVQFEGKMTIRASMSEFFELWDSWISQGYGSVNDRQYADVVKRNCQAARENPMLAHLPMVSEDAFSAVVKDGQMQFMTETTNTKMGVIPTSRVDWVYRRNTEPHAANSFEHTIDRFHGNLDEVQKFYQDLFDPKRINPDSKATVDFTITPVDSLPAPAPSTREFEHSVHLPLGSLLPMPATTLTQLESARPPHDEKFLARYGPWGVVTGASRGIGAEYARALAEKGMNVVMVARGQPELEAQAQQLRNEFGIQVQTIAADLGTEAGVQKVTDATKGVQVGLLVNNAGTWQFGQFLDNDIEKDVQSVGINVKAPLALTHHFAGEMAKVGHGGILNVGSGAALHGVPGQAAYSATKGFLRNFTEGLHRELAPQGIDVMITNPGPVSGEASSVYDQSKIPIPMVTGRQVALESLNRLGRGGSAHTPGALYRMGTAAAVRLMPRDWMASIAGYILEKATLEKPAMLQEATPTPSTLASRSAQQPDPFLRDYGPWGVVTGASQGLGAEYAEQLAKKGMNVVLVARGKEKMEQMADRLHSQYGVQVRLVSADLSSPNGLQAVTEQTRDLDVGLLVNNAGTWQFGKFLENDIKRDLQSVDVNVVAPMELTHEFGKRMAARGGGGILNVGSGAALHGVPGQATYSATKGALQNLTEALHQELRSQGVRVIITDPGPIDGGASTVYDQSKIPLQKLKPEAVVLDSLSHLDQRRSSRIPGWFNRVGTQVALHLLGRDALAGVAGYFTELASKT